MSTQDKPPSTQHTATPHNVQYTQISSFQDSNMTNTQWTDTQWPRYEVFKQDKPGKRHEAVGSVHAPDAEIALLMARDVFVRRPSAVSLWVVPANAIFAITRENMDENPNWWVEDVSVSGQERPFLIFTKTSQRRTMTYVQYTDTIYALSPKDALLKAMKSGSVDASQVWVWWVFAKEQIHQSDPADAASLFDPANHKTYRQQSYYGFVSPTRKKRGKSK